MGTVRPVAETQRTRKPVDPPTTITELIDMFARALDEAPAISRMHR